MLFDWQKKLVDEYLSRTDFGLFLDPGLGKTPISLAFAERHECTKILVVSVNAKATELESVKGSWHWWAKKSTIRYTLSNKMNYVKTDNPECLLVNYEYLYSRSKSKKGLQLRDMIVDFCDSCAGHKVAIILDESHACKNLSSSRTKSVSKIRKLLDITSKEKFMYLLSGTPFTKEYIDVYSQLKLLGHKGTKAQFEDTFCIRGNLPGLYGWQQPIVGYKNTEKLFELIHSYSVTIKSEIVMDLPDKIFTEYQSDMSHEFTALTQETLKESYIYTIMKKHSIKTEPFSKRSDKKVNNPLFRNLSYPETNWFATTSGLYHLRARQISVGFQGNYEDAKWFDRTRLHMLEEFLLNNEDNYVLFYNYVPELIEIFNICEKLNYNIDVYCGDVKSLTFYEKHSNLTDEEKMMSKKNIIVANFASGSTGMNWQEYNKCIIFSLPNYRDWAQGLKRVHRTGQTRTTFYYVFTQRNWLDTGIREALERGEEYTDDMFAADEERLKELFGKEEDDNDR